MASSGGSAGISIVSATSAARPPHGPRPRRLGSSAASSTASSPSSTWTFCLHAGTQHQLSFLAKTSEGTVCKSPPPERCKVRE